MPTPTLPLFSDPRVTAIRGFFDILLRDPDIKRVTRTKRVMDGSDDDLTPIVAGMCPAIGLTAAPMASNWATMGPVPESFQPIRITVQTWVEGTNLNNSVLLWGAIERAIYRVGDKGLEDIGVSRFEVKQPGWGVANKDAAGANMIQGTGVIEIDVYIPASVILAPDPSPTPEVDPDGP